MGCYNCDNLDKDKKAAGKVSGNLYYCKKLKTYVNPTYDGCEKFVKSSRKPYENDDIYKDGKSYYNDKTPLGIYIIVIIILLIIGLIMGVFSLK